MTDYTDREIPEPDRLHVSRRQVLSFAGLVLGSGVIQFAVPTSRAAAEPTAPATPDVALEPLIDDPVVVLSADSSSVGVCPRQLAVKVVNRDIALPSGTRLGLTFDPRVYAPMQRALVTLGAHAVNAVSEITTDPATGAQVSIITLHESVPATQPGHDGLVAVVGTARPVRYPRDLVRRAVTTSAEMVGTSQVPQRKINLQPTKGPAALGTQTPWSIELSGIWKEHLWGNGFRYYYPLQLTMRSVGPGATPVPVSFTVAVDPRLVREITITSVRLNGKQYRGAVHRLASSHGSAAYQTRWRTPVPLKPGDVLDLKVRAAMFTPSAALPTIKHPVVVLDEMNGDVSRRLTGLDTFTRLDSVWQSGSVRVG
jgi:hypothetical protein